MKRLIWKLQHFHAWGLYHNRATGNMYCPYCHTFYLKGEQE